jgi:predicted Zn-dependent protease
MGLTTAAGWSGYSGVFGQFVGSFRRLTDQAALNVRPNRISVAKVTQPMTLTEFNRRYPSAIEIDKLALINGLADGGAELEPGDYVKRVVAQ